MSALDINDAQPAMAESDPAVHVGAGVVGAPVAQGGRHTGDPRWINFAVLVKSQDAAKSAHGFRCLLQSKAGDC